MSTTDHKMKCLRGHEFTVSGDDLEKILDVNKKGTTFVVKCPNVDGDVVCGAPSYISKADVKSILGLDDTGVKQLLEDLVARKTGRGEVAPLQPPVPTEPLPALDGNYDSDTTEFSTDSAQMLPMMPMPATSSSGPGLQSTQRVARRAKMAANGAEDDDQTESRERKYPPIRVIEEKEPIDILKEVIDASGLKDDVSYTLHRVADLMDDGWTTDTFVQDAKYYGVPEAIAKGVVMRFRLEWKAYSKRLEEQKRQAERADGPPLGPFSRSGHAVGSNYPGIPAGVPAVDPQQVQQMTQQVGMQMLQTPMMQMWAQQNPREFDDLVRRVVEQTLRSQQQQMPAQPPAAMGMNPMMGMGMNPMMGMGMGMNPMMGFGMPFPSPKKEGISEEKARELIEASINEAMNDVKTALGQIAQQQQMKNAAQGDPILKEIVLMLMQQNQSRKDPDPMVAMLLEHVLNNNNSKGGDATEKMLLQVLEEIKKSQDSRYLDLDHLKELINLRSIEGELSLKQREFDDKRESRELIRQALNEGLTIVGSSIASTLMSRGTGGIPINPAMQESPVPTEMLKTDDGNIVMRCRNCKEMIVAPAEAREVICPFCNAQFPVVEPPVFSNEPQSPEMQKPEPPSQRSRVQPPRAPQSQIVDEAVDE